MNDTTTIICGECGWGTYSPLADTTTYFKCDKCSHVLASRDLDLDPGESIKIDAHGHLGYVSEA